MSNLLWHVWNFDIELHEDNLEYPFSRITRFHRVRTLKLQEINGSYFMHCSCGFYHRTGVPCPHFFYVFPTIEIEMFHVRCWKVFDAYYGHDSNLGKLLSKAQHEYFENEKNGIPVSRKVIEESGLLNQYSADAFPIFCHDTNDDDYEEAKFVMNEDCCTHEDLLFRR